MIVLNNDYYLKSTYEFLIECLKKFKINQDIDTEKAAIKRNMVLIIGIVKNITMIYVCEE